MGTVLIMGDRSFIGTGQIQGAGLIMQSVSRDIYFDNEAAHLFYKLYDPGRITNFHPCPALGPKMISRLNFYFWIRCCSGLPRRYSEGSKVRVEGQGQDRVKFELIVDLNIDLNVF